MKRDLDLYRRILLAVEQSDNNPADPIELDFVDDYAQGIVSYHVMLLDEEGLIKAARVLVDRFQSIMSLRADPRRPFCSSTDGSWVRR